MKINYWRILIFLLAVSFSHGKLQTKWSTNENYKNVPEVSVSEELNKTFEKPTFKVNFTPAAITRQDEFNTKNDRPLERAHDYTSHEIIFPGDSRSKGNVRVKEDKANSKRNFYKLSQEEDEPTFVVKKNKNNKKNSENFSNNGKPERVVANNTKSNFTENNTKKIPVSSSNKKTQSKFERLQQYDGDTNESNLETNFSKSLNVDEDLKSSAKATGKRKSNTKRNVLDEQTCGLDIPRRIIGGTTTDIDEFPWLCLLQYVDLSDRISHSCGGVLISKRYVLTAAHCTHGVSITSRNLKVQKVRLGEWDLSTDNDCQGEVCSVPVQDIEVEEIIPHENYKPRGKAQTYDISLIRLRTEANLNQYVQPICLPFNKVGTEDYEGKKLTVSGWGRTSNARDSSSSIKKKVDVPVVNWDSCYQFYQSFYGDLKISKSQFCAGGEQGKDSCQGDSGGPLMTTEVKNNEIHWYLIGIVSSGPAACGVEDRPSLYTNVSQYADWILENMRN